MNTQKMHQQHQEKKLSKITTFHNHCNCLWKEIRKCLKIFLWTRKGEQEDQSRIIQDLHPHTSKRLMNMQGVTYRFVEPSNIHNQRSYNIVFKKIHIKSMKSIHLVQFICTMGRWRSATSVSLVDYKGRCVLKVLYFGFLILNFGDHNSIICGPFFAI